MPDLKIRKSDSDYSPPQAFRPTIEYPFIEE